jgi:hypothetical protein
MLHHKSLNFDKTTRRQSHEDIFQTVFFDALSPSKSKTRVDWPSVTGSNPSWDTWKILLRVSKYHLRWVSGRPLWRNCRYVHLSQVIVFVGCTFLYVSWLRLWLCADLDRLHTVSLSLRQHEALNTLVLTYSAFAITLAQSFELP